MFDRFSQESYSVIMKKQAKDLMANIMGNPRYRGKHVIVVAGKVYTAKTGKLANQIIDRLEKKYPQEIPALTFVPKAETLIL